MSDLYKAACDAIDNEGERLHDVSRELWKQPEEGLEEVHAHKYLTDQLEQLNFSVDRHYILDTGFRGVKGSSSDGPHIIVICEYDALPEVGHACGHNLIAEVGVAVGIGIKAAFEANGGPLGKVTVLGTPAEETVGGKIDMVNAGVFRDVDVAMMAHPFPVNMESFNALACEMVKIRYHGKGVHACMKPWEGVNALDAAVLCYQNVSCMRQQMKPSWRVHGVINNGGNKPGIIPELTELEFYARSPSKPELEQLKKKLTACFESAATATGCMVDVEWEGRPTLDIIQNKTFSSLYLKHAMSTVADFDTFRGSSDLSIFSTDMGNVSYEVASIHPMFYIGGSAINHARDFAVLAGSDKAQLYTLATAKALACTAIDIYTKPEILQQIKAEFEKAPK